MATQIYNATKGGGMTRMRMFSVTRDRCIGNKFSRSEEMRGSDLDVDSHHHNSDA
jgi:hypothetical protein